MKLPVQTKFFMTCRYISRKTGGYTQSKPLFHMAIEKNNVTFQANDQANFESLKDKILLYEKERFVKLWVRDSRSIEVAKERVKHYLSDNIIYYDFLMDLW